jgi:hypothetical protein
VKMGEVVTATWALVAKRGEEVGESPRLKLPQHEERRTTNGKAYEANT